MRQDNETKEIKKHKKEGRYKIEELPFYIPKDFDEKLEIAEFLEEYILKNTKSKKSKDEFIDEIISMFHKLNIRIEDIEDYFYYCNKLKELFEVNDVMKELNFFD